MRRTLRSPRPAVWFSTDIVFVRLLFQKAPTMTTDEIWNALSDLTDPRPDTREAALRTLRDKGIHAIEPLRFLLQTGDIPARCAACGALAHFPIREAAKLLITSLHDSDAPVRASAGSALPRIGVSAVEPLIDALAKLDYTDEAHYLRRLADSSLTAPLLEHMTARQGEVRRVVMQALVDIGDTRALPIFARALHNPDNHIRMIAARALAASGPAALLPLLGALDDNIELRQAIAESIAAYADTLDAPARAALMLASRTGRTPVRWVADYVLSHISSADAPAMLEHALLDPDADIRLIAAQSVRVVTEANLPLLIQIARDPSAPVRRAIVQTLSGSSDTRALAVLVQAANDEDPQVRTLALQSVGSLSGLRELGPLISALSNRDATLRKTAAETLAGMEPDHVVPPLLAALDNDAYGDMARVLGRIGDSRAVEPLLNALAGTTYVSRQAVLEALGGLRDQRAIPALQRALADDTAGVREAAVRGLDTLAASQTIPQLVEALSDPAPAVREAAGAALEHMGPQVLQAMMPSLDNADWRVRLNAVHVLGRIGDVRAVEILIRKLHDPAGNVCGAVIAELKRLSDARCIGWLLRGLDDKDAYVRENVADVLVGLGDSYSLPRFVLAESRLSERDRAGILDYMRQIRYSDKHITFRFTAIGDVVSFCRQMAHDPDAAVQTGAKSLLAFIERLRAAQSAQSPPPTATPPAPGSAPSPEPPALG